MKATRLLAASMLAVALAQLWACGGSSHKNTVAPEITSAGAATFNEGAAGLFTVTATGTPAPDLALTGALPAGVTFDPSSGALSGTPEIGTYGSYPLVLTAGNGVDADAHQDFTLTVTPSAFSLVTLTDVQAAPLSSSWIDGNDDATNQIPTGTIVLYQTKSGRYGKLLVATYGYNLDLDWVTYDLANDGTVFSHGNHLILHGTFGADLDDGVESSVAWKDLFWQQQTSTVRNLIPLNGAKLAIHP